MWRWKRWSNVEITSWFRRSVLQQISRLRSDFHFQPCIGLQNQISAQAWIMCILPEDSSPFVEWSWLNSRISDLWKSLEGKQGELFGFTLNQTKNILFFLISHELETERTCHSDNPSTWNFLQEITSLHPAAARWNRNSWHFHAC